MKIVIDTNIVISGTFFGGYPRKILEAVVNDKVNSFANVAIVNEYTEIVEEMIVKKSGNIDKNILSPFINKLKMVDHVSKVKVSRDEYDDKFIECAIDSNATYIVSGDGDLLEKKEYQNIQIITAKDFCDKYLGD